MECARINGNSFCFDSKVCTVVDLFVRRHFIFDFRAIIVGATSIFVEVKP